MINKTLGVSVIVPFLNEEQTIPVFCKTIDSYVSKLPFKVELVFVNDGSTDSSMELIKDYQFKSISKFRIISFSKNYGSHAAIRAGIAYSSYDICTWLGMDLQEPLAIIPTAYDKIANEGFEAVYFEKRTIAVSRTNRLFSRIYSFLIKKYAVNTYSNVGTATIAFGSKIKKLLISSVEANSSLILQIMDMGFKHDTISLDYQERKAGRSKWTLSKKIKLFIDSFVSFSYMPIRMVSIIGIGLFIIGLLMGVITIINKINNPIVPTGYSTITCVLALGFGVTNISLGILAEYLWRTYDATKRRPVYIISDIYDPS